MSIAASRKSLCTTTRVPFPEKTPSKFLKIRLPLKNKQHKIVVKMFRRRWTVKEKLRLIRETEGLTLQAASDQFGVSPSVLCGWRQSKDKLQERFDSDKENIPCHLKGAGRPSKIDSVTQQSIVVRTNCYKHMETCRTSSTNQQ